MLMVWLDPGVHWNDCGEEAYEVPSTVTPKPAGLVVIVIVCAAAVNVAVTLRGAVMETEVGLVEPVTLPLQEENW